MELLIADPVEGFHVLQENPQNVPHMKELKDDQPAVPFGKVQYMALNAKKDILAMYCESETRGRIVVMKSNFKKELNRFDTKLIDAKGLDWCGNDAPVLTYPDKVVLVGPNQFEVITLLTKTAGIQCLTELDGLRIVTSEKTYFLDRV